MKMLYQSNKGFVFISSPYAAVLKSVQGSQYAMSIINQYAEFGCKKAIENSLIPFSPVLTFNAIFKESQREMVMECCFNAIKHCQALYVIKTAYFHISQGQQDEIAYAKSLNLPIIEFDFVCKR